MPILYKYLPPERTDILTSGFIMLTKNDPRPCGSNRKHKKCCGARGA